MKHTRVTLEFDVTSVPELVARIIGSPDIEEPRVIDWSRAAPEVATFLYAIESDTEAFVEGARATDGVDSLQVVETQGAISYVFLTLRERLVPVIEQVTEAIARAELIVRRPIVWRDGLMNCHVVGDSAALQEAIEALPPEVDCRIDEIGQFPSELTNPASVLSERQREAAAVALELGYYEQPREATHEQIAAELGCAPNTASEHLQKAEAKLVRAGMERVNVVDPAR